LKPEPQHGKSRAFLGGTAQSFSGLDAKAFAKRFNFLDECPGLSERLSVCGWPDCRTRGKHKQKTKVCQELRAITACVLKHLQKKLFI
jgi:hypothetical protein